MRLVRRFPSCLCACLVSCFTLAFTVKVQQSARLSENAPAKSQAPASAALRLTMQDALARARKNSVVYQGAVTDAGVAAAYQDGAVRYRVALANLQTLTGVLTTP